ncbi:MAG: hypothetical protein ACFNKM_03100 [Prevotella nigrescens]|uniref:hypothetical protein n=1 Tax=Prevotella nigrescens TaxID=28133 RepID=UPI00242F27B9|nr:hypothetical protein [Prevotella nigrescens]
MSQYPSWTVLPDAARKIAAKINDYLTAIVLDYSDVPPNLIYSVNGYFILLSF